MVHRIVERLLARPELLRSASARMTRAELDETERQLGFDLPQTLRDIYVHVGNGGFGPHLGLFMGGVNGFEDEGYNIVTHYQLMRSQPERFGWPEKQLTFFHWGCACRCTLDCTVSDGAVAYHDPGYFEAHFAEDDPDHVGDPVFENALPAFRLDAETLSCWFERWLAGKARMAADGLPWSPDSDERRRKA